MGGRHSRDPAVLPPADGELTSQSLRWTFRASTVAFAAWLLAGAVGAWCDLWGRYDHVTWALLSAARGTGHLWQVEVGRGSCAAFALVLMGSAPVASLIGTWRLMAAARAGRPHRGPSLWSIVGVALAVGLGVDVVGCFVASEIWSPSSDALALPAAAPQLLGLIGGGVFAMEVRGRFDPWRWAERGGPPGRTPTRRVQPASGGVSTPGDARAGAASAPPAHTWMALLRDGAVGAVPAVGVPHARTGRCPRVGVAQVEVTPVGVSWRNRWGRSGYIPAAEVAGILLVDVVYNGTTTVVAMTGLVLDARGGALLRVSAGGGGAAGAATRHTLAQMWSPLEVPVTRYLGPANRPKDLRRRWPEAFSWIQAFPITGLLLAAAFWMVVVVPVMNYLNGG